MRGRSAVAVLAMIGGGIAAGCGADGERRTDDTSAPAPVAIEPIVDTDRGRDQADRPRAEAPLDPRCRSGRVLCVDKSSRALRWVVDGKVRMTFDARFGGPRNPTREGVFEVYDMLRHHESSLYGTQMPFAMFFSGGQAVHYSREFANEGYAGASHGCVNLRDRRGIAELFQRVREGDRVVVYRS